MDNTGYCNESSTSDEDMVEIAGSTLDFSNTEDVPPLDRDYGSGKTKAHVSVVMFTRTHTNHGFVHVCLV